MFVEFTYGVRKAVSNNTAGFTIHNLDLYEVLMDWGSRLTQDNYYTYQLINVPDSLLFGLITSGMPEKCILYYDVLKNDMYLTSDIYNIFYSNYGNGSSVPHNNTENDMFDWGDNQLGINENNFLYKIPPECFDDFYEQIKPYYEYDFNNKLSYLCNYSFNRCNLNFKDGIYSSKESTTKEFVIECTAWFWQVLIHDMFMGNLFKEFSSKYPKTTQILCIILTRVQNHFLTTGNVYYDPRSESY